MCTEGGGWQSGCQGQEGDSKGLAWSRLPRGVEFPTNLVVGEGMWESSKGPPPAWGGEGEPGEGAGHSLGGGGPGKVWGTEPLSRLWGGGCPRRPDGATTLGWVVEPWGPIAHCTVCAHPRRFRWKTGSG